MKKILLLLLVASSLNSFAQCTELFFSEYVEGYGNNKAMEIYNPTSVSVNLSSYVLARFSNGNASVSDSTQLSGTIAPYGVLVIANGQTTGDSTSPACDPALQALADQLDHAYPAPTYVNGDDAMALRKNGINLDIFGKIGEDPGTAWTDVFPYTGTTGTWITKDHTMIRKRTVRTGVIANPTAFDPFFEYDTLPENTWTNLGHHICDCGSTGITESNLSSIAIYPNPSTLNQKITITTSSPITDVEFYNMIGEKAKSINFKTRSTVATLNISELAKGIYFIKTFTIDKQPATVKFAIQ